MADLEKISERDKERLVALFDLWNRTQEYLKRAELISSVSMTPAINELRYAGRVLVVVLARLNVGVTLIAEDPEHPVNGADLATALTVANQYLLNAKHDISDALLYFFIQFSQGLNKSIGRSFIESSYPSYSEFCNKIEECRNLVIASRGDILAREKNYRIVAEHLNEIIPHYYALVEKDSLFRISNEKRKYSLTIVAISAALIGAAVGSVLVRLL